MPMVDHEQQYTQRDKLVAAARSLHPLLRGNADLAEEQRRLPDENFKAMTEAGVLRLMVPRRFGGQEGGHRTYLDVVAELARSGCGSSAWYAFILNMDDWLLSIMSPEAQAAVWAHGPDSKVCCPLTPAPGFKVVKVNGGVRISGEWGYTSGCYHGEWVMVGYPVFDAAGAVIDMSVAVLPMSKVTIKDTWYVAGMAGTGSNTIVLEDVFVPEPFTQPLSPMLRNEFPNVPPDGHMYRADISAVFWTCVAPPLLGLAQAALDLTVERMTGKPKPITYTLYRDASKVPSVQANLAQAATMIDAAWLQARSAADEIDAQALTGERFPSDADRHRQYMRSANATRLCVGAMDLLLDVQGASAFAKANPIQRIWRDLNTAARHGFNAAGIKQEFYGRSLLHASEQHRSLLV